MSLMPRTVEVYHVFLASPGDVNVERQHVRRFFDDYNRHTAHLWGAEFKVIDWENYATIGIGRPQELITQQTLEKYKNSLALVVGLMAQRFGSPSGKAESGTEEEFQWAKEAHDASGFPEIKWFFRKIEKLEMPADPDEADKALDQWKKVRAFRKRMQDLKDPIFFTEYPSANDFAKVFDHDLNLWLNDPTRPWASKIAASGRTGIAGSLPAEFDSERYRAAVTQRFDKVNFEMLDSTGAYYSGVRLWSVFVPQSARECHQYNPRLLEIPKDHQQRLLKAGEISEQELADSQQQAEELRREYFQQPLRPVLEVVDQALRDGPSRSNHRLVILGDPGSGKSSLIRYLSLRWSSIADRATRDSQPIPLVIDLGAYSRWNCDGRKGFVRFLEEAPVWHDWPAGLLVRLLAQPGRIVLLLDGLDEIFDLQTREEVVNDIQRFSTEYAQTSVVVTSRVVGYQSQRLRDAEFRHFMLQDLDAAQIDTFIDHWHSETFDDAAQAAPKLERLKKAIRDSKSIAMLAGNPLLLTMMAILNRNQELPRDRAELYAQAARLMLHQWDTDRALAAFPGLSTDIGWREKHDILRRVAGFMQSSPNGLKENAIDGPTLTSLIEDHLHDEFHFPNSRAAARVVVEHLWQRNFILCLVGADRYGFVHRAFLEYFCAADIVYKFSIARTLSEAELFALFDVHSRDDEWREVLRLICSQVDEQIVGQIVERLATRIDLNVWNGVAPLPELALAIYCLSEVRDLRRLENAGRTLMDRLTQLFTHTASKSIDFLQGDVLTSLGTLLQSSPPTAIQLLFTLGTHASNSTVRHFAITSLATLPIPSIEFIAFLRKCFDIEADDSVNLLVASHLVRLTWEDRAVRSQMRAFRNAIKTPSAREVFGTAIANASQMLVDRVFQEGASTLSAEVESIFSAGYPAFRVSQFRLRNIGVFEDTGIVNLKSDASLFLGNNSAGKTTILKAIALALIGVDGAYAMEDRAAFYLRNGTTRGIIEVLLEIIVDPHAAPEESRYAAIGLKIDDTSDGFTALDEPTTLRPLQPTSSVVIDITQQMTQLRALRHFQFGFLAGYGATRTFSENRNAIQPELTRDYNEWVISLFRPDAWLVSVELLANLLRGDTRNLSSAPDSLDRKLLEQILQTVSSILPDDNDLFPSNTVDIVLHRTPLCLSQLSDGYKSVLALVGHVVRCVLRLGKWRSDPATMHGVVLIDEVELHLHPSWQKRILTDLRSAFPRIQFIVTSHSPLVSGATDLTDTFVLRNEDGASASVVCLASIHRSGTNLKMWRADQLLTGPGFQLGTTISDDGEMLFHEYERLLDIPEGTRTARDTERLAELANILEKQIPRHQETKHARQAAELIEKWAIERIGSLDKETVEEMNRQLLGYGFDLGEMK